VKRITNGWNIPKWVAITKLQTIHALMMAAHDSLTDIFRSVG